MSNIVRSKNQSKKRVLEGVVVSNLMKDTVVVKVVTKMPHPVYKKVVKRWKKYKADTLVFGKLNLKDKVTIQESRRLSKTKNWVVISKKV